jgi:hypothetical protein
MTQENNWFETARLGMFVHSPSQQPVRVRIIRGRWSEASLAYRTAKMSR